MHFYVLISKLFHLSRKKRIVPIFICFKKSEKKFFYYVVDRDVDILVVTETWLKADACCDNITRDVTPTGYTFVHSPRLNGIIGGVGMLYRTNLKVQLLN